MKRSGVVMFHHFHGNEHPRAQGSWDAARFEGFLSENSDRLIGSDVWTENFLAGDLSETSLAVSFDDGLLCQFEIALPLLERFGIRAFWFVPTAPLTGTFNDLEIYRRFRNAAFASHDDFYDDFFALHPGMREECAGKMPSEFLAQHSFYSRSDREFRFARDHVLEAEEYRALMKTMIQNSGFDVERESDRLWMSASNLRQLSVLGHTVGLHSHTHPTHLSGMGTSEQMNEYRTNARELERILGFVPHVMAHPSNSYDDKTLEILKSLGVEIGFRSDGSRPESISNLALPRIDAATWKTETV